MHGAKIIIHYYRKAISRAYKRADSFVIRGNDFEIGTITATRLEFFLINFFSILLKGNRGGN
jgi:hypothetical protein